MGETRHETPEVSATARLTQEQALLQADEQALAALREQQQQAGRLSLADEQRFVALESAIRHSHERLPTLHAQSRQERAQVDVTALVEAWQPLMASKIAAYDALSALVQQVWQQVLALEGLHGEQAALLEAIPDDTVRRYLVGTFWIDAMTMRARLANNMFPSLAWTDFFLNPLGYRVGSGSTIAQNDPGVTPIPPAIITNVVAGHLWAERAHRAERST